jgi:hypothetical protein
MGEAIWKENAMKTLAIIFLFGVSWGVSLSH